MLYNLVNEPWLKYSMAAIADQGLRSRDWTSARLRGATLYLETATERFELAYSPPGDDEERAQVSNEILWQPPARGCACSEQACLAAGALCVLSRCHSVRWSPA